MPPTSTFELHDRVLGGRLPTLLRRYRAEGLSYASIAFALRAHGVEVDPATVGRWLRRLDEDTAA